MSNQNRKIKCDLWMKTKYMVASWQASERWIALNRFKFGRALCLVPSKPSLHNVPSKPSLPTCEPCALHGALCDTSCPIPLPSPFLSSTLLGQSYYCWSFIWWNKVKSGIVFVASHLLRRAKTSFAAYPIRAVSHSVNVCTNGKIHLFQNESFLLAATCENVRFFSDNFTKGCCLQWQVLPPVATLDGVSGAMPYQPRPRRTMPTTVLCQVMPRRTMSTTMHCAELAALLSGCPCSAREGRNIQPSILHPSILHPYYTHPYYIHTTSILHPSILHPFYTHPYYTHPSYIHTTPLQTALHKSSICILSTFQCMQFSLYKKIIKSNDSDQWKMTSTKNGSVQSMSACTFLGVHV